MISPQGAPRGHHHWPFSRAQTTHGRHGLTGSGLLGGRAGAHGGEEMDVGEGRGQPRPRGQLGTVSAGESWLPTRLEAFAAAPLGPTGLRTACLHPLASNILPLLSAWLPGVTAPPQSNPPNVLTLLHPYSAPPPNSPRPITSLLLSALLSALLSSSGPVLLGSTSPTPFCYC